MATCHLQKRVAMWHVEKACTRCFSACLCPEYEASCTCLAKYIYHDDVYYDCLILRLQRLHSSPGCRRLLCLLLGALSEDLIEDSCAWCFKTCVALVTPWLYLVFEAMFASYPWQAACKACVDYFSALAGGQLAKRLQTLGTWSSTTCWADSDAQNPIYIHYYTLLHITAFITIIQCP